MSWKMNFDNTFSNYSGFLKNEYVSAVLTILLILYASLAAPRLPYSVIRLLDNDIVRFVVFFLIALLFKQSPHSALIAAIVVVVVFMMVNTFSSEMMTVVYNDKKYLNCTCGCDKDAPGCDCNKPQKEAFSSISEHQPFMKVEGNGPVNDETTQEENQVKGYNESSPLADIDEAMSADEMTRDIPTFDTKSDGLSMLNSEVAYRKQDTDFTGYEEGPTFASVE